jgi:hypothetical protein
MRFKMFAAMVALAAVLFAVEGRADPTGVCVDPRGCDVGPSSSGPREYAPREVYEPSPAELKQQQMVALQKQGLEQFRVGNFSEALRLFGTVPQPVRRSR